MKNFKQHLILLIIPIFFGLLISYLYYLRGPHFIQIPQDLAYQSIFNALNLINGEPPGMLLYLAITLNYINLIIIYFYNLIFWWRYNLFINSKYRIFMQDFKFFYIIHFNFFNICFRFNITKKKCPFLFNTVLPIISFICRSS